MLFGIEVPQIILFPASHKYNPVFYKEKHKQTRLIMEFVEKHADIKITLTEKSHLHPC